MKTKNVITFRELLAIPAKNRPVVKAIGGLCHGEIVTGFRPNWWFVTGENGICRPWCVTPQEKFEIVEN